MSGNVKTTKPAGPEKTAGESIMNWPRSTRTRNVHVDVFAKTSEEGFVEFSHKWRFEDEPTERDGTIDLPEGQTAYRLHFHLKDNTEPKMDLSFVDKASEAMWVAVGEDCPKCAGNGAGQILFKHEPSKQQLVVDDLNSNVPAMKFQYALRFEGAKGQQAGDPPKQCPPYEYDPDFKNGGGNT